MSGVTEERGKRPSIASRRNGATMFADAQGRNFVSNWAVDHLAYAKGRLIVREALGTPGKLRESSYRVTLLVMVIGCHLGLLILLLRPVVFHRDSTEVEGNNPFSLKLRFFKPLQPSSPHPALPAHRLIAPAVHGRTALSARESKPLAGQQAARVRSQPYRARLASAPNPDTSEEDFTGDGGFRERLHNAQHSGSVHGVPGSDTPFVPGIHLVNPMSQGIGALMRTAQRALGITNSHCVDVDVWRHLALQELSARHISPSDVDKVDEKYGCNNPSGLHF